MQKSDFALTATEEWVKKILANPVTKQHVPPESFQAVNNVIDARVFLVNTHGYNEWKIGQDVYEKWEEAGEGYKNELIAYKKEIENDAPIYEHFNLKGDILDVGGGLGTVREFLSECTTSIHRPFHRCAYAYSTLQEKSLYLPL